MIEHDIQPAETDIQPKEELVELKTLDPEIIQRLKERFPEQFAGTPEWAKRVQVEMVANL